MQGERFRSSDRCKITAPWCSYNPNFGINVAPECNCEQVI